MKKGFTLAETIIVIIVIVGLVLFVLPKLYDPFTKDTTPKVDPFSTEVASVAQAAKRQWTSEDTNSPRIYSRCLDRSCPGELDIYTKSDLEYYVHIDGSGVIDRIYVKDRNHQYICDGEFDINNIVGIKDISTLSKDEIVIINSDLAKYEDENMNMSEDTICKRARRLHTSTCEYDEEYNYCSGDGYTSKGSRHTNTITYGNHGSYGTLNPGDAFDCDVNGDGKFDPDTERFYYVSDYYNTHDQSFDSDYATLIYYSNVSGGNPVNNKLVTYDINGNNANGPVSALEELPTSDDWSNVSLRETTRQVLGYKATTSNKDGELSEIDYSGYAARLITVQEIENATKVDSGKISERYMINNSSYLFERTDYSFNNLNHGYWMETVSETYNNKSAVMYARYRNCYTMNSNAKNQFGVRPVIDVEKNKMFY